MVLGFAHKAVRPYTAPRGRPVPSPPDPRKYAAGQEFKRRIDALNKERGWSFAGMAARAGMDTSPIYTWIRGEYTPRAATIQPLALALDVKLDYLTEPWAGLEPDDSGPSTSDGLGLESLVKALLALVAEMRESRLEQKEWTKGVQEILAVALEGRGSERPTDDPAPEHPEGAAQ